MNTVAPLPVESRHRIAAGGHLGAVAAAVSARKLPSALVDMLNHDPESPFFGLIKRASSGCRGPAVKAVVTDTSLVEALKESLESPSGVLFPYRNMATGTTDTDGIRRVLLTYWTAVRDTFPDAWGSRPPKSKLMGGVGIRAMGRLMDASWLTSIWRRRLPKPTTEARTCRALRRSVPLDQRHLGGTRPALGRTAERLQAHQRPVQLPCAGIRDRA